MPEIVSPPQQQRSRDSLERLLAAGQEILETEGIDGFTIGAVVDRAGVGRGLVYRRFADKNALLAELFNRFARQRLDEALPAMLELADARVEFARFVFEFTNIAASMFRDHELEMNVFISANRGDPDFAAIVERGLEPLAAAFESALLRYREEFRCEDPELAVAFCTQAMLTIFAALVAGTNRVHSEFGWETATRQLSMMVSAHLRAEPPATITG